MDILRGIIGMVAILGLAFIFSNNKRNVNWKLVGIGIGIQFILAIFILKADLLAGYWGPLGWPMLLFQEIAGFFVVVLNYTTEGASFIFGRLGQGPEHPDSLGVFFAFQVLPTIVFFASLTAILYHYGILQFVVKMVSKGMQKLLGTSGAETLSVVSNIFVGQTEAPLVIEPYIEKLTKSELMVVMTGGMATIAGGVLAAYVAMLGTPFAEANGLEIAVAQQLFAERLLGASLMAAPAALVIAKILYPEDGEPVTKGEVSMKVEKTDANGIDAAATGAGVGLKLALNVGAMLLAFIALLAMFNGILGWGSDFTGITALLGESLTIEMILGWVFAPLAWIIGVPWSDAVNMGSLLGTKIVLNEFVAYLKLAEEVSAANISPKTIAMATFALCGFANFSSIAIQIGGIGGLAPSRKSDLAKFGVKAVFAGTLANLMTATFAGMLF
ncbi:MAG: NupC/NupG family nucleoside CNT transporter [Gracilimonas sp.]|uniref:NupC/NupG family nucleoside CNT transporter n=1 Tax=Gracilimonas sp. TaxID=1974203 RepID=UPI0019A58B31|nr:nucleoside transporter C-terminal domain-containing protein [Gracilimonas sp.]MBD3615765.1 NupC/NupG family nucleoside CNT transporter [Gracilimonas sp.]